MGDLLRRAVKVQIFTPVVTPSSAYTANNIVGTLFEIKNGVLDGSGKALLKCITGISLAKSDAALLLVLFSQKPAGTYTDKSAFNPSAADVALITGVAAFGATWKDFATASATTSVDLDVLASATGPDALNTGNSTSLWGILVATGTPTFATAADLTVKITFEQY